MDRDRFYETEIILALPLIFLPYLAFVGAVVWLFIIGQATIVKLGILFLLGAGVLLAILLYPSKLLGRLGSNLWNVGRNLGAKIVLVLVNLWFATLITVYCGYVFFSFLKMANSVTVNPVPLMLFSYGLALVPWSFKASWDVNAGVAKVSLVYFIAASIGYILVLYLLFFTRFTSTIYIVAFIGCIFAGMIILVTKSLMDLSRFDSLDGPS